MSIRQKKFTDGNLKQIIKDEQKWLEQINQFLLLMRTDGNIRNRLDGNLILGSSLLTDCLLEGESSPLNTNEKYEGGMALLKWAINQQIPFSPRNQDENGDEKSSEWRRFLLLEGFYLHKKSVGQFFGEIGVSDSSWARDTFLAQGQADISRTLSLEFKNREKIQERREVLIETLYSLLTPDQRHMLLVLFLNREPVNREGYLKLVTAFCTRFVDEEAHENTVLTLGKLLASRLITENVSDRNKLQSEFSIHPDVNTMLVEKLNKLEFASTAPAAHQFLAGLYLASESEKDILKPAYHLTRAGEPEKAANELVKKHQRILNSGQSEQFYSLTKELAGQRISRSLWMEIKLCEGKLAEQLKDFRLAETYFREVIKSTSSDPLIKARAYKRLAKVQKRLYAEEAEASYLAGIKLFLEILDGEVLLNGERKAEVQELLFDIQIDRAWYYIEQKQNSEMAAEAIEAARTAVKKTNNSHVARLKEINAFLLELSSDDQVGIRNMMRDAWETARNSNDNIMQLKIGHNWAMTLAFAGSPNESFNLIENELLPLARSMKEIFVVGSLLRVCGACYFFMDSFEMAQQMYCEAKQVFESLNSRSDLCVVFLDLAENALKLKDMPSYYYCFTQSKRLAEELDDLELRKLLSELDQERASMDSTYELNENEWVVFSSMINGEMMSTTDIGKFFQPTKNRMVVGRILKKLIELSLISKHGDGKNTRYQVLVDPCIKVDNGNA